MNVTPRLRPIVTPILDVRVRIPAKVAIWNGREHVWVGGRWELCRDGFDFVSPHWVNRFGRFEYLPGRWVRRF